MEKKIIIFDIDGTLVESSEQILEKHANILNKLKNNYEIAICGGGTLQKALYQMNDHVYFDHYFTECGCVYNKNNSKDSLNLQEIYVKNIRLHPSYPFFQNIIKEFLKQLCDVDYKLSGHFVDLRNGIVYLSCVGLQASKEERETFIKYDSKNKFREDVILKLKRVCMGSNIVIKFGGSCGIAVYPFEYDKCQTLDTINKNEYDKIIYFGDKYTEEGNDYLIMANSNVIDHKIDNVEQTYEILEKTYLS
jgi:HAD superfamily hydrolase (TIGR01484 family)